MEQIKEPYYLDSYNTSVKSFTVPHIAKTNSFTSIIKRNGSLKRNPSGASVSSGGSPSLSLNNNSSSLYRSNSLEPYFKPNVVVEYDLDDCAIVDDDEDDTVNYSRFPNLPPLTKCDARDDFDNEVKFDFFL